MKIFEMKAPNFLAGDGEMRERIRSFGWQNTPLGSFNEWSLSLQSVVSLMLCNRFPMILWWGKEYIQFYNDPYIPIPGLKHPDLALGKPAKECWNEIWHVIGPLIDTPFNGGPPTWMDDILLLVNRRNFVEETHFTIAYSPVPDSTEVNGIGGVLATVKEITEEVINRRSLETLRKLSAYTSDCLNKTDIFTKAAIALSENNVDFPFVIIYTVNPKQNTADACAYAGIDEGQNIFPQTIDLSNPMESTRDFCDAFHSKKLIVTENDGKRKNLPKGAWTQDATHFINLPVLIPGKEFPYAIIFAALNPFRRVDDLFHQFATLIGNHIATEINKTIVIEEERKRVEALAEIDKAKTLFFTNISHEFRTPITLILGAIEAALDDRNTIPVNINRLNAAHRNAGRLLKLVNTLLDFSRIEGGRQQANFVLTDISSFTKNLASNFRSVIENAGLEFVVNTDSFIQPVYIDKRMWEKIVFNLLSNAFKYTLKGKITVTVSSHGHYAILMVEDTGVGIPEKELPHMFERFHRVQNTRGRTFEGTGIGLSLVKELVHTHGGTISVTSTEGVGSKFSVDIPFGKEHLPETKITGIKDEYEDIISDLYVDEAKSLLERTDQRSNGRGSNSSLLDDVILIVDDNVDMREYIQSLIEKKYSTITAANGMDALHKIRDYKPSVILSDIMMPVMDGIQLLKEVKQNPETAHIPVIFITARAGEESQIEGWETGADDYLVKPFSAKELLARVNAQIKIKQRGDAALQSVYKLFDEVPFAVAALKGDDLIIEYINQYNLDIWHQTREEVLGRPLLEARPDMRSSIESLHKEVFRTGQRVVLNEIPIELALNGEKRAHFFNAVIDPMYNEQGDIIGQLATSINVTEQVEARKKVEEANLQLQQFNHRLAMDLAATRELQQLSSRLIYEEETMDGVFDLLLESAIKLMQSDLSSIQLYDPQTQTLTLLGHKYFHPESAKFWKTVSAASGSVCGEALRNRSRIIVSDVEAADFAKSELGIFRLSGIRSVQSTPLISRNGHLIGMINTQWHSVRDLVEEDFKFFDLFARQAADLIEQKAYQQKILENKQHLELLSNTIPALIYYLDLDSRFVSCNDAFDKWFGVSPGSVVGLTVAEFVGREAWSAIKPYLEEAYEGKKVEYESEVQYRLGNKRWIRSVYTPHKNSAGMLIGVIAFVRDITEDKKAEIALRESEEKFRTLTEALPQLIWMTDAKGEYEYTSNHWTEYSGINFSGKKIWEMILHSEDVAANLRAWTRSLSTGETYKTELRLKDKTGTYRWHYGHGEAIRNTKGEIVNWIGAFTDVHEQKIFSEELERKVKQRTEELVRANRELESFNFIASHDLQEPVRKLRTFISMLRAHKNNENIRETYSEKIDLTAKRMSELIKSILAYSRLSHGNETFVDTDLTKVLENVKHDLELRIEEKGAVIQSDTLPTIKGNPLQMQQLFSNLINNSLKFSKEKPHIIISSTMKDGQKLDGNSNGDKKFFELIFSDNGIGFDARYKEKIFELFQRLHGKDEYSGTGIGLSICKKIVEAHGGSIAAEPKSDGGAIFKVILPAHI